MYAVKQNTETHLQDDYQGILQQVKTPTHPVIGRDKEISEIIEILCRKGKSNPILTGDPGVGKTALIEALALKILEGDVPSSLKNKKVYNLDLSLLLKNVGLVGEIFNKVRETNDIVYIDEIHNVVGAGKGHGSLDAANILKPYLTDGDLSCIGATTHDEYAKYFEADPAFERRFNKVAVKEPSQSECLDILKRVKTSLEAYHDVKITTGAIKAAIELSVKHIRDRRLPDKAIDILDQASARKAIQKESITNAEQKLNDLYDAADWGEYARYKHSIIPELKKGFNPSLKEDDVTLVVAEKTGIPVTKINEDEREKLKGLESNLNSKIFGQADVMKAVSDTLITKRLGLKESNSSFMFLGSSGVGKTQTAKELASLMFESEDDLIIFDMSEYKDITSVNKFIGASAGYVGYEEGGILTNSVRKNPYSVILFDEVEKAHPEVFDTLLQVLDQGRLTDNKGRTVDFKDTVIIFTSNLKQDELGNHFRVEFLNRIDEILNFNNLSKNIVEKITRNELNTNTSLFKNKFDIIIEFTDDLIKELVDISYNEKYGARNIKRTIQKNIVAPLSKKLLSESLPKNKALIVTSDSMINL